MDPRDPIAWPTDDGQPPEALQRMLHVAQQEHGNAAQLARLAAKLGPALAPPPGAVAPATSGVVGAGKVALTWWQGALLVLGLAAAGTSLWYGIPTNHAPAAPALHSSAFASTQNPAPDRSPRAAALPEVQALSNAASSEQPLAKPAQGQTRGELGSAPRTPRLREPALEARRDADEQQAKSAPNGEAKASALPDVIRAEATLLQQARVALAHDAQETWRATETHRQRFPSGLLAEEREILAIQSLVALERHVQARARLRNFEHAFPGSVHTPGLHALLERAPAAP